MEDVKPCACNEELKTPCKSKDYRLLSLTSHIMKTLEKLIAPLSNRIWILLSLPKNSLGDKNTMTDLLN